jgi:hypothetical protein
MPICSQCGLWYSREDDIYCCEKELDRQIKTEIKEEKKEKDAPPTNQTPK